MDYIHYNPVKHGLVTRVADWPFSSFHRYVAQGILPGDWAGDAQIIRTASANERVGTALCAFAHPTCWKSQTCHNHSDHRVFRCSATRATRTS